MFCLQIDQPPRYKDTKMEMIWQLIIKWTAYCGVLTGRGCRAATPPHVAERRAERITRTGFFATTQVLQRLFSPPGAALGGVDGAARLSLPIRMALRVVAANNFDVPVLKNGIHRVVYTNNNSAAWRSLRLGG
jgi:hypothetical protein